MAIQASIRKDNTVEMNVTSPDGTNTLFITNGIADFNLSVLVAPPGSVAEQQGTFAVLLREPVLAAGQFRRAIATASMAGLSFGASDPAQPTGLEWALSNVDADFDDESGRIELRFDVFLRARGSDTLASQNTIGFQVITLAAL